MDSTLATATDLEVTTRSADALLIDFANHINEGETIASATAVLLRTTAVSGGSAVSGFVVSTSIDVDNHAVTVNWTGSVLVAVNTYLLIVAATLNTGKVVPSITEVGCVA